MSDFERLMRKIELELFSSKIEKGKRQAYFKGQDHARREILYVTLFLALVFCFIFCLCNVPLSW